MNASGRTVEEQAVRMRFDNVQFESAIAKTLMSLAALKHTVADTVSSINSNVFSGLKDFASQFNTRGMEKSISEISENFSLMGKVGNFALQNLTNKAVDFGLSLFHKVLSPLRSIFNLIKDKGWARATNEKQAEFMIKNLGLSWKDASKDIDEAVQDTRFGFDEAAVAAAQLATSGVKFGDDMPDVLKAIGNAASMANVEYSDMAHIFTTMASNGRVYGEQLQQMSYRGINATKALADYLGKTEAQVKKLVSSGKVSFEDFVAAINEAFGDAGKKANDTFTGVLANNKAVFARIGKIYASGFMDAAKEVLQHTLPKLKQFEKAIKPIGETAAKAMEVAAKFIVPIIDALDFTPIKNFIDKYVAPVQDYLQNILDTVNGITEGAEDVEEILEMAQKVIRGDYGNGAERRKKLEELGYSYERIQNKVNELLGCSFRYEVQEDENAKAAGKTAEEVLKEAMATERFAKALKIVSNLQTFAKSLQGITKLLKQAGEGIRDIFIKDVLDGLVDALVKGSEFFAKIGEKITYFIDRLYKLDPVTKVLSGIVGVFKLIGDAASFAVKPVLDFFNAFIESEEFKAVADDTWEVLNSILTWFSNIYDNVKKFASKISNLPGVKKLLARLSRYKTEFGDGLVKMLKGLYSHIDKLFKIKLPEDSFLSTVFEEGGLVDKAADKIDWFLGIAEAFAGKIEELAGALFKHDGNSSNSLLANVYDVLSKISEKIKLPKALTDFFSGDLFGTVKSIGGKVVDFFVGLFEALKGLGELEGVQKLAASFKALFSVITKEAVDLLGKGLEYLDKLLGSDMFSGSDFINFFGEGGVVDTAALYISKFVDSLRELPGLVQKAFEFFTGSGDGSFTGMVGEKFSLFQKGFEVFKNIFKEAAKGVPNLFGYVFDNTFGPSALKSEGKTVFDVLKESFFFSLQEFGDLLGPGGHAIVELIKDIAKAISNLTSVGEAAVGKFSLGEFIGGILEQVYPKALEFFEAFKMVGESAEALAAGMSSVRSTVADATQGVQDYVVSVDDIKKKVGPVLEHLGKLFKGVKNWSFEDWVNAFKEVAVVKILFKVGDAVKKFGNIFSSVSGAIQSFGQALSGAVGSVGSFFDEGAKMFDAFKEWGDVSKVFKEWRKKPLTTALRDFAIAVALVAGSIWLLSVIDYDKIRAGEDVLEQFAMILGGLMVGLTMMGPELVNNLGNFFVKLGAGIFLLSAAVMAFGHMDRDVLIQGGEAVIFFAGAMATAAMIAGATAGTKGTAVFLGLALGVDLLVPAVLLFGKMKPETVDQGGKAVVKFVVAMAAAAALAGLTGPTGIGAFIGLALAVDLLVPAVLAFGLMKPETVAAGGRAVVAFISAMTGALMLAKGTTMGSAASFLAIAAAVDLLVPALLILGMVKLSKVIQGTAAIVALMIGMGQAIKLASTNQNSIPAAIAMAGAAYLVGITLMELTNLNQSKLLSASVSLGLVFAALSLAFSVLGKQDWKQLIASASALALAVIAVGGIVGALAYFTDAAEVLTIALSLSALILVTTAAIKLLGNVDPAMAAKAGLAVGLFIDIVGLLVGVFAAVAGAVATIDGAEVAMNRLGLVLNAFFLGLHGDKIEDVEKNAKKTEEAGSSLSRFAETITTFLDLLDETDETKVQNAQNLADAMLTLCKAEFIQAIQEWLGMSTDYTKFSENLTGYATAFYGFVEMVNGNEDVGSDKLDNMLDASKKFIDLANLIGPNEGLFPKIAGITNIGKFGEQLLDFGEAFYLFYGYIKYLPDIDVGKMQEIKEACVPFIDLANLIGPNEGLFPRIAGITNIGKFGEQLATFITGFVKFNDEVAKVDEVHTDKMSAIAEALGPMIEAANTLTRTEGLLQGLIGEKDLENFGGALGTLGKNLNSFIADTAEIDTVRLNSIALALTRMASLDSDATNAYTYLSAFADALAKLGNAISTYLVYAGNATYDDLTELLPAFIDFRDFIASLSGVDLTTVDSFAQTLTTLGKTGAKSFSSGFNSEEAIADVDAAVRAFYAAAVSILSESKDDFGTAAGNQAQAYSDGFANKTESVKYTVRAFIAVILAHMASMNKNFTTRGNEHGSNYAKGIDEKQDTAKTSGKNLADKAVAGLGDVYKDFKDKGNDAAEGFAAGIRDKADDAAREAYDMVADALRAAASAQNSASPSKEFAKLGRYADEGYALGIRNNIPDVTDAINMMVAGSLATMMLGVQALSAMIDEELDSEPVIRPVLDTSGVAYGIEQANMMLNTLPPSALGALASTVSTAQNQQSALKFDRDAINYSDDLNGLLENTDQIIKAVKEGRVAVIDGNEVFEYVDRRMGMA